MQGTAPRPRSSWHLSYLPPLHSGPGPVASPLFSAPPHQPENEARNGNPVPQRLRRLFPGRSFTPGERCSCRWIAYRWKLSSVEPPPTSLPHRARGKPQTRMLTGSSRLPPRSSRSICTARVPLAASWCGYAVHLYRHIRQPWGKWRSRQTPHLGLLTCRLSPRPEQRGGLTPPTLRLKSPAPSTTMSFP